jgi:hypothetical protein
MLVLMIMGNIIVKTALFHGVFVLPTQCLFTQGPSPRPAAPIIILILLRWAYSSVLRTEATGSSKTVAPVYQAIRRHDIPQCYRCDNVNDSVMLQWVIAPYNVVRLYHQFGGTHCIHLRVEEDNAASVISVEDRDRLFLRKTGVSSKNYAVP